MNGLQKAIDEILGYDPNHIPGPRVKADILDILHRNLEGGACADVSQDNRLDSRTCACNHKGICYATKRSMGKFCRCRTIGDHADCPAFVVGKQEEENAEGCEMNDNGI